MIIEYLSDFTEIIYKDYRLFRCARYGKVEANKNKDTKIFMSTFKSGIDVDVPVSVAYNQWTQFEDFPHFMNNVESITQMDDDTMLWKAEIAGVDQEWMARITEQIPDQRIAWTNTSGATNAGVVTFHPVDDTKTRVMLQIDYEPEGFIENVGDALGFVERSLRDDLTNFKEFIEQRGVPTGSWRGEIEQESY